MQAPPTSIKNKGIRNGYMNSFSYEINNIYLQLKRKDFTELLKNKNIVKFVSEIQKNEFTDAQLYVLAKLLCYLIKKKDLEVHKNTFIYPPDERFNKNKMKEYWDSLIFKNELNTKGLNAKIQKIVSDIKNNKNIDKVIQRDIILRFIDEFIEVSKENSDYSKILDKELKKFSPETLKQSMLYDPVPSRTSSKSNTSSNKSRNNDVELIRRLLQGLKDKSNIDDIIRLLIRSLENLINKTKFPDLLDYQLAVFLSNLFNFSIKYISDEFIQSVLSYIIYYFVNPEMKLPDSIIFSNKTNIRFTNSSNLVKKVEEINKKKIKLLDFLKVIFGEFQIPDIFTNLFGKLTTRIYLLEEEKNNSLWN
jgi:hypothetical protein